MSLDPTQNAVQIALAKFLRGVLPTGILVVAGVQNRVPEPKAPGFVVMVPIRFARLRTNVDTLADVRFTGSIAGTTLTVTAVDFGAILEGATLFGVSVAAGTTVGEQTGGVPGGVGTYDVSVAQTLASRTLASGAKQLEQGAQVTVQLDFHTADNSASDLAQTVATIFRDPAAVEMFAAQEPNYGVVPLFADDPRYIPFVNESQQYEWRWSLEASLQVNQVLALPQQFADAAEVDLRNVDATFPP